MTEEIENEIKTILYEVEYRTGFTLDDKDGITKRLYKLSKELSFSKDNFIQAVKDGSSGRFGVAFKLNFQVIGNWMHRYYNSKNKDYAI